MGISIRRRASSNSQQSDFDADLSAAEDEKFPASFKNMSVIRAFTILKAFYHPEEWVSACELSRRARIHEATLHRFLHSLLDVGAIIRDNNGRYRCVLFVMPGAQNGAPARNGGH
jgi:hypothetical protein